jgi:hypothetical protein
VKHTVEGKVEKGKVRIEKKYSHLRNFRNSSLGEWEEHKILKNEGKIESERIN